MINLSSRIELPRFDKLNDAVKDALVKSIRAEAKKMARGARQDVPVDDGDLKRSIKHSVRRKKYGVNAEIKAGLPIVVRYAAVVEYGGVLSRSPAQQAKLRNRPDRRHIHRKAQPYMWPNVIKRMPNVAEGVKRALP